MGFVMKPGIVALAVSTAAAMAQEGARPPLEPGLWQVAVERDVNGRRAPDMSERLASMRPEARKQMEAMLKQRGVDLSGGSGKTRVCLSRDSLDEGRWLRTSERCRTSYGSRTASAWTWHSVCTGPASEVDGEATFASRESYVVKMAITSTHQGQPHVVNQTLTASWLGADCGDVKPLKPPGKP